MSTLMLDIEVFHEFFYVAVKRLSDGQRFGYEMSSEYPRFPRKTLRDVLARNTIVTFNGQGYDLPLLWYVIEGADNAKVKKASDAIIRNRIRWWQVEEFLGINIPRDIDHIDLIEPQPSAFASLKTLNGRLHGNRLQDLPFDPHMVPDCRQRARIAHYCRHSDLDATDNLWTALQEAIELRRALGEEYGMDFRSKSDAQIGEAIIKKRVEAITGSRPRRVDTPAGAIFKYAPPDWMSFETTELRDILSRVRETEFEVKANGKVEMPKWLDDRKVVIGDTPFAMGIGGLHSTESGRSVHSDADHVLVDADVASQYPSIILQLGLTPKSLGKSFLEVYGAIKAERLVAKKAGDKVKDKGLKIALNGSYGKLGSPYSVLYAPHLMIATTLTGQLSLLMLIERAHAAGIPVVSGNTDGVVFRCPRKLYGGLDRDRLLPSALEAVTSAWEKDTGFDLEFQEYASIWNQSVNSYFAIKPDGGHKRKGPLGNPWCPHPSDFDPRAQLMKNPQATICSDAALARIKHGTDVAETIRACRDIRQFVTVIKADGGATWRGDPLGKVVRYYWSTDGDPIIKVKKHPSTGNQPKVPKTEGARPCMDLPDEFPGDIDYDRYEREATDILTALGWFGDIRPPQRSIRITKANRRHVIATWATAP